MNEGRITVKLGGRDRILLFNAKAVEILAGVKLAGKQGASAMHSLVYAGLVGHNSEKNISQDFTFSDVVDWVDELALSGEQETLAAVSKCFTDCPIYSHWLQEIYSMKIVKSPVYEA